MIQVIIADDHEIIRRGVRQIISETSHIRVIAEVSDGKELMGKLGTTEVDLLLLDISMPGRSGLDILSDLKKIKPRLPVLILSIYEDDEYIRKAIQSGVSGYISKTALSSELIRAIEVVAGGGRYISEKLATKIIFTHDQDSTKPLHENLTDRELEVLKHIARGQSPRLIAADLAISVKTVNAHREHILRKMNMKSNAELIRYGIEHFLPGP